MSIMQPIKISIHYTIYLIFDLFAYSFISFYSAVHSFIHSFLSIHSLFLIQIHLFLIIQLVIISLTILVSFILHCLLHFHLIYAHGVMFHFNLTKLILNQVIS